MNTYSIDNHHMFILIKYPALVGAPKEIRKCQKSIQLEARVCIGLNEYSDDVEWSIEGYNASGTNLTSDGLLTIADDEDSTSITISISYDDGKKVYSNDYTIPVIGHDWDDGIITKNASCTEDGVKLFTCKYEGCGEFREEVIKANGHNIVIDNAVEPTCTTSGQSKGQYCSICEEVIEPQTTIPALGHDWDNGQITEKATCTQSGIITYRCSRQDCNETKSESIPVIGHNFGTPTWKWTGTTKAVAIFTCKNDNSHVEKVEATITSKVTTSAACTTSGVRTYTATVKFNNKTYKTTKTAKIAAKGHNYGTPTWKWTGTTKAVATFTCKNDSSHTKKVTANITSKVTKKATTTTVGTKTYTATVTLNGKTYTKTKTAKYYVFDKSKTGLQKYSGNGNLYYVKNGVKDASFTGFAKYGNNWYYVIKGIVNAKKLGVFKGKVNGVSATWYVKDGKVQLSFTGTVTINKKKYKVVKGKVQ